MAALNNVAAVLWALLLIAVSGTPARAQVVQESTRWGLTAAITPEWEFMHFLEDAMDKSISMKGDEVRIGVVRGTPLGGEWGISYVKRRVDDGSTIVQEKPKCLARGTGPPVCAGGVSYETRGALLNGFQLHRFFPFGSIARRVQIGAVVSGGVARLQGQAYETVEHLQGAVGAGGPLLTIGRETRLIETRQIFSHTLVAEYLPIGGVEAAVAVLVAPGMKIRVSAGASFPGLHRVSLTASYLFGGSRN